MSGKFVGKLSDGGELSLQVDGEEVIDDSEAVVEWMLDNGYADEIKDSVMSERYSDMYFSPQFIATAVNPSQENAEAYYEAMQREADAVIEDSDLVTYPGRSEFRTPEEALDSVERGGLRLEIEAFAEDRDMPHRALEKIPFSGSIENRSEVEYKLGRLDECLHHTELSDLEFVGYKYNYFPGLEGQPTPEAAIEDIKNGISLYTELKKEGEYILKAGYLRPNISDRGYGGGSIDAPFFGYLVTPHPDSENGSSDAQEIVSFLRDCI